MKTWSSEIKSTWSPYKLGQTTMVTNECQFFLSKIIFILDILLSNKHFQNFLISILVSIFLFVLSPC